MFVRPPRTVVPEGLSRDVLFIYLFILIRIVYPALSKADARKVALDQWCLRRILDIRWYHRVSNCEVWRLTEQPSPYYDHTEKKTHAVWPSGQNG